MMGSSGRASASRNARISAFCSFRLPKPKPGCLNCATAICDECDPARTADGISGFFQKQQQERQRREFSIAMERARNTMRAVRIAIQEGEYDEAERMISEALGEGDD